MLRPEFNPGLDALGKLFRDSRTEMTEAHNDGGMSLDNSGKSCSG